MITAMLDVPNRLQRMLMIQTHKAAVAYLFMAALSFATAASTSVMMLPGPMAFTLTLCGAKARAIHLPIKVSNLRAHRPAVRPYNRHAHDTSLTFTVTFHRPKVSAKKAATL